MTHAGTNLHVEVLGNDGLTRYGEFKSRIVERTAIAPIVVDTCYGVVEALQGEQVAGMAQIVIQIHTHTIVQPIRLQSHIKLPGLLEGNLIVTDIVELCCRSTLSRSTIEILHDAE